VPRTMRDVADRTERQRQGRAGERANAAKQRLTMPSDLHMALQSFYARTDGRVEVEMDGYRADVLRGEIVYEIQTGSFTAIRDKLRALAREHPVVLVHCIARHKFIAHLDPETGAELSCRRSPKQAQPVEVFGELVYAPDLLRRDNLALEIVIVAERELRCDDGAGSWRRKGVSIIGRELMAILEIMRFERPADLHRLLPDGLPEPFTTGDLATLAKMRSRLAGRMAYALREAGAIEQVGKRGNAYLYVRTGDQP